MAPHRSVLLAAFAALALLSLVPASDAVYAFGSVVDKNDYDQDPVPSAIDSALCFMDLDGDGVVNNGEAVYVKYKLATCTDIAVKDIRLTPYGSLAAGTQVKPVDADYRISLAPIDGVGSNPAHAIRAADLDGDTKPKKADAFYLDLESSTAKINDVSDSVDVGDIRLTPYLAFKAGTMVQDSDPDVGNPLREITSGTPALKGAGVADGDHMTFGPKALSNVFEAGKGVYLNIDRKVLTAAPEFAVEEGDIRLTAAVPNLPGDLLANIGNPGPVVDGLTFSKKTLAPGEMFQVLIAVKNPTAKVGSALVKTSLDGVVVDARGTPSLVQNEVSTLVVSLFAPLTGGQHKVTSGDYTAFFDVQGAAASATPATLSTVTVTAPPAIVRQDAPGVAPVAVLGVLVVALLALRRRVA